MSYIRLTYSFIASLLLHLLVLFMIVVFVKPLSIITKPKLIQVGVFIENKQPGVGSGNSPEPPLKEPPKPEKKTIVEQKAPPKIEKKDSKTLIKKREEIARNKEKIEKIEKSEIKKNNLASSQNDNERSEQSTASFASTSSGMGSSKEGKGFSTEGSGEGGESAYPDYKLNPKPKYPMIARMNGYEGKVLLKVLVLKDGKAGKIDLEKSSGYGILDKSAIESVQSWIFIPGKKNGIPISSWVEVPIKFELSSG